MPKFLDDLHTTQDAIHSTEGGFTAKVGMQHGLEGAILNQENIRKRIQKELVQEKGEEGPALLARILNHTATKEEFKDYNKRLADAGCDLPHGRSANFR